MTYRIRVLNGPHAGSWVHVGTASGLFSFGLRPGGETTFPTWGDARDAISKRNKSMEDIDSTTQFQVVPNLFANVESTPGASRQQSYHFIGGPKDGAQLILQDGPPEYHFQIAPRLQGIYDVGISLYGSIDTGRAVYVRLPLGVNPPNQQPTQRYTVYVFSHIDGLLPTRAGEKVVFENRVWTITDLTRKRSPKEVRFEAGTSWPSGQARLSGDLYDLYYVWDREVWALKTGSVVVVDETRTVVVT